MSHTAARLVFLLVGAGLARTAEAKLLVKHIVVDGSVKTAPHVLESHMRLHDGDPLAFETLASAEQRLVETGLFTKVRVYIELPDAEAARQMYVDDAVTTVDVHVAVTEKTSWFVVPIASLGSGDYGGGVAYGDQNLLGEDLQVVAAGQIGQSVTYGFAGVRNSLVRGLPLAWELSGIVRSERIRFFADHDRVLEVPTFIFGGEADLGWVLSPHVKAMGGFSARFQQVDAPEVIDPSAAPTLYNPREGKIFLMVFQIAFDNTTAPDGLRSGVRLLLKNELADRYWGSDFDYSKFAVRSELYGHLDWNYPSLVVNLVVDYPTSSHGVPLTEMLRVGGTNLRGYLVNEFHGDTLVSAQLEDQAVMFRNLPLPFVDSKFNIAAAIFVDVAALLERHPGGTSIELPVSGPAFTDFHTSFGAGLRIILPGVSIPAIKADLGYGIDVKAFALTISIAGGGS